MSTTVIKTSDLPQAFLEVHPHNLYLYCKAYAAGLRANTAQTKNRSAVRGGGKKPWAQKGGGRARAGSLRSPIFVGGGVAFGPSTNRNYNQKVNKKQKKLALYHAVAELAANDRLFVVDSITIDSGKTKDAKAFVDGLGQRDVLVVKELIDDKSFLAFRNLQNAYLVEANELNAYLAAAYHSVVIEKAVWEKLTKES
ncbi:MAG: 50S ribosomal protein L4 [Epsilonproteobacteria bacterium]|nr:50S ribosomal protein L4 [Campylobacterota bacterium]